MCLWTERASSVMVEALWGQGVFGHASGPAWVLCQPPAQLAGQTEGRTCHQSIRKLAGSSFLLDVVAVFVVRWALAKCGVLLHQGGQWLCEEGLWWHAAEGLGLPGAMVGLRAAGLLEDKGLLGLGGGSGWVGGDAGGSAL